MIMAECEREEAVRVYPLANGRLVRVILRNSIIPEDPYINMVRAKALSVRTGEPYSRDRITRSIKDHLIKTNISI
jgi:hypothetical protein